MKRTLTTLTVTVSLMASGAYAYDDDVLKLLKNLSAAKYVDPQLLSQGTLKERTEVRERLQSAQEGWESHLKLGLGIDLSSADLSDIWLSNISLSDADLSDADLSGAILAGATFSYADLSGADLSRANLSDADLSGANLSDANLDYATMNGVILCNTTMPNGSVIYSGC